MAEGQDTQGRRRSWRWSAISGKTWGNGRENWVEMGQGQFGVRHPEAQHISR